MTDLHLDCDVLFAVDFVRFERHCCCDCVRFCDDVGTFGFDIPLAVTNVGSRAT